MKGHRVGQGQLTQPPILQGCVLWRNLELPSRIGMSNTQVRALPGSTICKVTSVRVRLSVWPGVWASVKAHKGGVRNQGGGQGCRLGHVSQEWRPGLKSGWTLDRGEGSGQGPAGVPSGPASIAQSSTTFKKIWEDKAGGSDRAWGHTRGRGLKGHISLKHWGSPSLPEGL